MLRERNIAFFIDVDNVGLKSDNYFNVIEQLNGMGTILSGKIYGAGERKHKEIFADAELHGYRTERPMRVKRRGRKDFDPRIFVDVVDAVTRAPAIDAVCIVAMPTDLIYLYSYLRGRGIKVIALDNADDASCAFIDEVVDLGIVLELKLPNSEKPTPSKPVAQVKASAPEPAPQATSAQLDRTDELLREIERLRNAPQEQPQNVEEAPVENQQPAVEEQPVQHASIADEARQLLERISAMKEASAPAAQEQPAPVEEPLPPQEQPDEPVDQQPQPQPQAFRPVEQQDEQPQPAPQQRTPLTSNNDSDLIRKIEDIRRNSQGGDDDFVEEIRKLLDGLE